jgi:uncharacterized protein (DUF1684 family)
MQRVALALGILLIVLANLISTSPAGEDEYRNEIERWRQKRQADLKAEDGWLSVSGLFWLKSGDTSIGSDPSNDVLLPARLPGSVGSLKLTDDKVSFRVASGVSVTRNGKSFDGGLIQSDAEGQADILAIQDVKLILLKRGTRFALRIKDNQSLLRTNFAGLRWYPPSEDWRIQAKFVPYSTRSKLVFDTIVGASEEADSPGYVTFERRGKVYRLQPATDKNGSLWFVFRDGTSGRTTHGGARQLYADAPRGENIVLDFNKATNLPCAYIPYATCPLAPPQNRLSLPIEAGELMYEPHRTDSAAGNEASR